eukprot:2919-Chlamydomonas_euryale.AAC.1
MTKAKYGRGGLRPGGAPTASASAAASASASAAASASASAGDAEEPSLEAAPPSLEAAPPSGTPVDGVDAASRRLQYPDPNVRCAGEAGTPTS